VANLPVVAVVGVIVTVPTVPTFGVVKEAGVPVVPLVVLAVVCDSVVNVDGAVALSTTYTQSRKKFALTHTFDNTTDTHRRMLK